MSEANDALHRTFLIMVCFVHDRRWLSQFHAIVNKLRRKKQFTNDTLRQLPRRCCSCPEKRKDMVGAEAEPRLTSLDLDTLQHMCIVLDLKRSLATSISSSPSPMFNYTILSFPTLYPSKKQMVLAKQFIDEHNSQLPYEQQKHQVDVQFVTSNTSQNLLNEVIQCQYALVTKCSTYSKAKQVVNSLWVILSAMDSKHIDSMQAILQKRWAQFLETNKYHSECNADNEKAPHQVVTINTWCQRKKAENERQKALSKQQRKLTRKIAMHRPRTPTFRKAVPSTSLIDFEDEYDLDEDDTLIQDVKMSNQARLQFLFNRFDNSSKRRQPRTHRRQHLLALVLAT